jgi:HAD superfamily phosphatase
VTEILLALDIDGVIRDVSPSYRRALADTVEHYTLGAFRPTNLDIDTLKGEGIWNNDWEGAQELIYRYFEKTGIGRTSRPLSYAELVEFFQARYFGSYIHDERLLVDRNFFETWDHLGIGWGFVSGAERPSAEIVLCQRLGLINPPLVAMGEAADKPNPEGLFKLLRQFPTVSQVIYAGDTVADMLMVNRAAALDPARQYFGLGILPPHNQSAAYQAQLQQAGAKVTLRALCELTPERLGVMLASTPPDK